MLKSLIFSAATTTLSFVAVFSSLPATAGLEDHRVENYNEGLTCKDFYGQEVRYQVPMNMVKKIKGKTYVFISAGKKNNNIPEIELYICDNYPYGNSTVTDWNNKRPGD
jgi:uncharacterized protein YrzB (UPF0473 family)